MTDCQPANDAKRANSPATRLIATAVFLCIVLVFTLLWMAEKNYVKLGYFFGVCGFKQRFGLPCPGCGWTHAAQAFVAGDVVRAFQLQPAAAIFCCAAVLAAILALHTAVFGIHSRVQQILIEPRFWKYAAAGSCVIILLGWLVTLARALSLGNGGL